MKKHLNRKSVLYIMGTIIFSSIVLFSGYKALEIYIPQSIDSRNFSDVKEDADIKDVNAESIMDESAKDEVDKGILNLSEKNKDFVGWLSIEDTEIDYPVMKSSESDPEYYLHRDFNKNYSYSGTLFIGEGCNADSTAFIIYGHNMNAGTMFGNLDRYKDSDFANEHKNIVFRTPAGNRVYRVFAAFRSKIYPEGTDEFEYYRNVGKLNKGEYSDVLSNIRNMSLISTNDIPKYPDQIMLLSTCYYHTEEGRFVVASYRVK